ncbi:hypothetical protein DHEL01_v213139 [Diaporthe helianthi]|uniref:Uncharacterized protein n=1 Tax=Diaporthe helianthi TaxID=158607 RepID=A0A2P5HDZ4_DIAHE|nr:hypothetical protein DHEL01_v213139 [Diaporthe helianthi]
MPTHSYTGLAKESFQMEMEDQKPGATVDLAALLPRSPRCHSTRPACLRSQWASSITTTSEMPSSYQPAPHSLLGR